MTNISILLPLCNIRACTINIGKHFHISVISHEQYIADYCYIKHHLTNYSIKCTKFSSDKYQWNPQFHANREVSMFGGLPMLLVLALSITSTRGDVLADLSILLNPFIPSRALTDFILQWWYKFFYFKARVTVFNFSGSSNQRFLKQMDS